MWIKERSSQGGPPPPETRTRATLPPQQTQSNMADFPTRVININAPQQVKFRQNGISTAKYSFWSFLPSFLFEQFRRYSNIFFLTIALLQQIPDVSPTGRYTTMIPLIFILTVSAIKEVAEDIKRHRADSEINSREVEVLKVGHSHGHGHWHLVKWRDVCVGDFVKIVNESFFPADLIVYSSSEPDGLCYIETSNLDGETNLKVRQGLAETAEISEGKDLGKLTGVVECELPNRNLYEFVGKVRLNNGGDISLGPDQIVLRGAKLQNTGWIYGQVVFTGHETKLMKNSTAAAPLKRSTLDKITNVQIIMLFALLILVAFFSAVNSVTVIDNTTFSYIPSVQEQATASLGKKTLTFLYSMLTFVILYNNLIPISLTVTIEMVRYIQAIFIGMDRDMFDHRSGTPAMARTSNLNEELGQVRYIFSDKTGTLTRNVMEFKGCTVGGKFYGPEDLFEDKNELIEKMIGGDNPTMSQDIRNFLVLLSVCHTVIPDENTNQDSGQNLDDVIYHAASPDDRALVYGARDMDYVFEARTPNYIEIRALGVLERYEILNVLEFTSTRKRMSIIVQAPDGQIRLYCKGADSVIYERLQEKASSEEESIRKLTQEHLETFSKKGLRTLCCGMREISLRAYEEWQAKYHAASTAIQNREQLVEDACNLIETNLRLLGATAIEDKLQDKVPETIAAFLQAGINVWVLTGDKQETAINIGYSCRLLTQSMELLMVNCDSLEATKACILGHIQALTRHISGSLSKEPENNAAVIIDGKTLKFALSSDLRREFLELCCSCRSVLCCRASPIQKAEIVEYVTQQTGAVTLAIGDGANDVAMIQKAHVGIGISGVEGLQAACASDYAIAQFHFLKKLLFVHGAWNYDRMCKMIFYSYYKNICLYIIELWFAIYSAWSGQVIFERWTIGCYNMLFTCAQPIAMGIFERHCTQETRLRYPALYKPNKGAFSLTSFFIWVANSVFHSVILFWLPMWLCNFGVVWENGREGGYLVLGNFIYTYVVVVVSLKSGLETRAWTIFAHLSIWGSILFWLLFLTVYSYIYGILPIGADMVGIAYMLFSSPVFYLGLFIVPCAALTMDVVKKAIEDTMYPSLDERFRQCEILNREPSSLLTMDGGPMYSDTSITQDLLVQMHIETIESTSLTPQSSTRSRIV